MSAPVEAALSVSAAVEAPSAVAAPAEEVLLRIDSFIKVDEQYFEQAGSAGSSSASSSLVGGGQAAGSVSKATGSLSSSPKEKQRVGTSRRQAPSAVAASAEAPLAVAAAAAAEAPLAVAAAAAAEAPAGALLDRPAPTTKTWREAVGRESGRDGYVFGDLTRSVVGRLRGDAKLTGTMGTEGAPSRQTAATRTGTSTDEEVVDPAVAAQLAEWRQRTAAASGAVSGTSSPHASNTPTPPPSPPDSYAAVDTQSKPDGCGYAASEYAASEDASFESAPDKAPGPVLSWPPGPVLDPVRMAPPTVASTAAAPTAAAPTTAAPSTTATATTMGHRLRAAGLHARARLLYAYLPYDRSTWQTMQSPASLMIMVLASWPSWATRTIFFAVLLLLLLLDLDEYQVIELDGLDDLALPCLTFHSSTIDGECH